MPNLDMQEIWEAHVGVMQGRQPIVAEGRGGFGHRLDVDDGLATSGGTSALASDGNSGACSADGGGTAIGSFGVVSSEASGGEV